MNSLSKIKRLAPVLKIAEPAKDYAGMTDAELVIACQAKDDRGVCRVTFAGQGK